MPERKSSFLPVAIGLLSLAFAVGFFVALVSVGRADVLYKFALPWEAMRALISLADWAPAILLVAAAIATESSDAGAGFVITSYSIHYTKLYDARYGGQAAGLGLARERQGATQRRAEGRAAVGRPRDDTACRYRIRLRGEAGSGLPLLIGRPRGRR